MKAKLFYVGQKVTPIEKKPWFVVCGPAPVIDVKFGDVFTVTGYDNRPDEEGNLYIFLKEMPKNYSFAQHRFAPVVSDSVLSKELEEIFQEEAVQHG